MYWAQYDIEDVKIGLHTNSPNDRSDKIDELIKDLPPASFAEIDLVREDLRRVPQPLNQIIMRGELGVRSNEEIALFNRDVQELHDDLQPTFAPFKKVAEGDDRAHIALMVRAISMLLEAMDQNGDYKKKITEGPTDRWLWLVMRKL